MLAGRLFQILGAATANAQAMTKKGRQFIRGEKIGDTVSCQLAAPGDTNLTDAPVFHLDGDDEERSSVFKGKNRVTPSVAAPGDTNPSDATVFHLFASYHVFVLIK